MAHKVEPLYLIKNEKNQYYTGDWRREDQWDERKHRATEFPSVEEIVEAIKKDRKDADEGEGFSVFGATEYTVETIIRVIDLDYT